MHPNCGQVPAAAILRDEWGNVTGYRAVHVILRCGYSTAARDVAPWPAGGGRWPTRWTLTGHPFDIVKWTLADPSA